MLNEKISALSALPINKYGAPFVFARADDYRKLHKSLQVFCSARDIACSLTSLSNQQIEKEEKAGPSLERLIKISNEKPAIIKSLRSIETENEQWFEDTVATTTRLAQGSANPMRLHTNIPPCVSIPRCFRRNSYHRLH